MKDHSHTVILEDSRDGKKTVEISRFDLDETHFRLIKYVITYLEDNGYSVTSSTDIKNQKHWSRRLYHEISFRYKRITGLFRNKIEYGNIHSMWIGYNEDKPILQEVIFKIDDKQYAPSPALQEIYRLVGNRE